MKKTKKIYLFIIILLFLVSSISISSYTNKKISQRANNKIAALVGSIQKEYPDITDSQISQILNRETDDFDLKKYGINNSSELIVTDDIMRKSRLMIFGSYALLLLCLLIYYSYSKRNIDYNLDVLIGDIDKIDNGIYQLKLNNGEDKFSKLQSKLYKITTILKEKSLVSEEGKNIQRKSLEDISHQIKTPLTAINLLIENLADNDLDENIKSDIIKDLETEVDAITNLVLSLLKISSLEAKTKPFKKEKILLAELIKDALTILQPIINDHKITIINNIEDQSFIGDFTWEKEVYINLIKNAIEHSQDKVIYLDANDTNSYLEVLITNMGETIDEASQKKIFDRFYKQNTSDNNFGIGLNLAKLIVEEDTGTISVRSENMKTTFSIKYYKFNM